MSTVTMIKELSGECRGGICFRSNREMNNAVTEFI